MKEYCLHDLLSFRIGWVRRYGYRTIKSRKVALRCRGDFIWPGARNDGQPRLGDRKFLTANKNAEKVEHANIFRRTRAIPKSFAQRAVGEVLAAEREVGCWRMEKRRTCICTGKLNIHVVQIRPPSDSFYRLLLLL